MPRALCILGLIALLVSAAPAQANPKRLEALARVDRLIESGKLEEADQLLGHLIGHNPNDPDLRRLREKLRVRQGKLELILAAGDALADPERRPELREACWRIVAANATGSPEEIRGLVGAGEEERLREVLAQMAKAEAGAPRTVAAEILAALGDSEARARLDARVKNGDLAPLRHVPDAVAREHAAAVEAALAGATPPAVACELAARLGMKKARKRLVALLRKGDPTNRVAAAGALLALGDRSTRRVLETVFAKGSPSESVAALGWLAAYPGPGETPRLSLLARVEKKPPVPRLKGTMVDVVLAALGRSEEPGAREELLRRLKVPSSAMAAARALGELGDPAAVRGVLACLRKPPKAEGGAEGATAGGLGFMGRRSGGAAMERAIALEPHLVGAVALLRMTRPR